MHFDIVPGLAWIVRFPSGLSLSVGLEGAWAIWSYAGRVVRVERGGSG